MQKFSVEEIERRLTEEIATVLSRDASAIKPDAPLHTLGMDSMSFVEVLVFIEKAFHLKLIESGLTREDFQTIRALASRICRECP